MQDVTQIRTEEYDLICPITLRTFRDPVIAKDGHTYEREAIVRWITENGTSPLTRQPLNVNDLLPDYHVRDTAGRRPSSMASFNRHDEPMVYRSSRVTPINDKVLIAKGESYHVSREGPCCRRWCCIPIMVLSAIVLLACALTVGLLMRKYSDRFSISTFCNSVCTLVRFTTI
jgi:hypothetical protein